MLISLIAFSQAGTDKICFPVETAKKIAVDLARGDSAIAELTLTKEVLKTTEEVVVNNWIDPPPQPTYTVVPDVNVVSEGETVTFTVTTTSVG